MLMLFLGSLMGTLITLLLIWVWLGLIARRANTMQPVVLPPDAASDLSLGRSADRERWSKLKMRLAYTISHYQLGLIKTETASTEQRCYEELLQLMELFEGAKPQDAA